MSQMTKSLMIGILLVILSVGMGNLGFSQVQVKPEICAGLDTPRLVFNDMIEFETYMKSIINQPVEYLDQVEDEMNFRSLRRMVDLLDISEVSEEGSNVTVEDPYFASVLNEKGEVQIGDNIYVVTEDIVYHVPIVLENYLDELDDIEALSSTSSTTGSTLQVKTYDISRTTSNLGTRKDKCKSEYKRKRRLYGKSWVTNWFFYASAGATTESQKKSWWWRGYTADILKLESNYNLTLSFNGYPVYYYETDTYSKTQLNSKTISKTFLWGVASHGVEINGWINSRHYLKKDNKTAQCTTSVRW